MLEQRIVDWGKARLAPNFTSNARKEREAVAAYRVPTLLQRFTSRFKRARAN